MSAETSAVPALDRYRQGEKDESFPGRKPTRQTDGGPTLFALFGSILIPATLWSPQSCNAGNADAESKPPRPNIIFLLADELGWKDVSYHGSRIKTPNLDGLAKAGTRLEQFYVQPVCSPTRASLMTGRYPMRYGLQCGVVRPWAQHGLSLDEMTLATVLQRCGYRTAVTGKWHLGHVTPAYLPLKRGFDRQYGHYNGALDYFTHLRDGGHDWNRDDQPLVEEGYTTDLIGREAARLIKNHDPSNPLFLYVPFNAPHTSLQALDTDLEACRDFKMPRRRTYAAMVIAMDRAVGTILNALKQSRLDPGNTLVWFSSDNGGIPSLGSNGILRAGKGTLYEGGVRVPSIVSWPGHVPAGSVVDAPLHMVDVLPTLARLAGGSVDGAKPLDGHNAWQTILGRQDSPHDWILHNLTPFHAALRQGPWKLIINGSVSANAVKPAGQTTVELFNLENDPQEKTDLSETHPDLVAKLNERIEQLRSEAAKPQIPPNSAPPGFEVPKYWGHPPNQAPASSK